MRQSTYTLVAVLLLVASESRLTFADAPATQRARLVVSLTDVAAKEVKAVAATQNMPQYWLRVAVKPHEDGKQYIYVLDITEEKPDAENDTVLNANGVKVAIDRRSAILLQGTVIDFRDDDTGRGFVFRNPNAAKD